jgi:hypothetical protein
VFKTSLLWSNEITCCGTKAGPDFAVPTRLSVSVVKDIVSSCKKSLRDITSPVICALFLLVMQVSYINSIVVLIYIYAKAQLTENNY